MSRIGTQLPINPNGRIGIEPVQCAETRASFPHSVAIEGDGLLCLGTCDEAVVDAADLLRAVRDAVGDSWADILREVQP